MRMMMIVAALLGAATVAEAQTPYTRPDPRPQDPRETVQPLPLDEAKGLNRPAPRAVVSPRAGAPDPCMGRVDGICGKPRWIPTTLVPTPKAITFDWPDGAGGDLSYGGGALGISADGKRLFWSCVLDDHGIAVLELPAAGTTKARVLSPCLGPTRTEIAKIHPDQSAFRPMLGGVLEWAGGVCVDAYISYDANNGTTASHWCGPDLAHLAGPFRGAVAPGLVKSQMGRIPADLQPFLGGPAFVTAGYTSIISRASYGAAFTVFDPATITRDGFPMQMLLGCPHAVPSCITYGTPTSNDYNGSELSGGAFIVPGTRTLFVVEREASGPTCYGYATRDPNLHGQPYLDAVYCYSLSDPLDQKGPKGYPYRLAGKLYDLAELVEVRAGTKKPWDIRQYATLDLPGSSPKEFITSGAFNDQTGCVILVRGSGGGMQGLDTLCGFPRAGQAPPPPTLTVSLTATPGSVERGQPVTLTWDSPLSIATDLAPGIGPVSPPAGGSVTATPQDDTTYRVAVASADGQTSAATAAVTVTDPPPPAALVCEVRSVMTPYANGDGRYTIRCYDGGNPVLALPRFFSFGVVVPKP